MGFNLSLQSILKITLKGGKEQRKGKEALQSDFQKSKIVAGKGKVNNSWQHLLGTDLTHFNGFHGTFILFLINILLHLECTLSLCLFLKKITEIQRFEG